MRTLILNASWEPMTVISRNRAVVLVLLGKAEVIEESDDKIRSEKVNLPVPTVIKLKNFIRVPYRKRAPLTRRSCLARDDAECCYCTKRKATTIDHVHPRSRGGRHEWMNVVSSCSKCNATKADRTPDEAGMTMRYQPRLPEGIGALRVVVGTMEPTWEPYLMAA